MSQPLKKSFLLFEVILTIIILSIGLSGLLFTFHKNIKAYQTYLDYSQALTYLSQKNFDLELDSLRGKLELSQEGGFEEDPNFKWRYFWEELEGFNSLKKLTLEIFWGKRRRKGRLRIESYLFLDKNF